MDVKQSIKDVDSHLVKQILAKQFKVLSHDRWAITVLVEGVTITFWLSCGPRSINSPGGLEVHYVITNMTDKEQCIVFSMMEKKCKELGEL
jgi:hypothetical protein